MEPQYNIGSENPYDIGSEKSSSHKGCFIIAIAVLIVIFAALGLFIFVAF